MPSAATITTFYTFQANTKARASQVNTNFNNYRGHLLPIDPNTQAAAHNTYDIGSEEYNFRTGYFGTSIVVRGLTTTSNTTFQDSGLTLGGYDVLIAGTIASRLVAPTSTIATLTASYGQWAVGDTILGSTSAAMPQDAYGVGTLGAENIRYSTLTIATTGRPVKYGLIAEAPASDLTSTVSIFDAPGIQGFDNGGGVSDQKIYLMRNGTTLQATFVPYMTGATASGGNYFSITYPGAFELIDYNPPATTSAQYELSYRSISTLDSLRFAHCRFYAREM